MMFIFPSLQLPGSCTCKHLNFLLAQSVCMANDIWLTGTWRNGIRSECCSYHGIIFIKRLKYSQTGDHLTCRVQIPDVLLQQQIQQGQDVFIFLQSKSCRSSVMEVLVFCGQPERTHQQLWKVREKRDLTSHVNWGFMFEEQLLKQLLSEEKLIFNVKSGCCVLASGDKGILVRMDPLSLRNFFSARVMGEAHQGEESRRRMERCFQIYCVCTSSRKLMVKWLLLPLRFKPIKGFEESYSVLWAMKNKRDPFRIVNSWPPV
ncbi:uncharacterized protein LOC115611913 isoform X2 [Strigops habroptila]|uniref:uncharacterized protein LOC115611913 isoform X2 n=1 Tax=Strigops habroptila TaxID=2489341 RepID=UPI0011CF749D|nr:uncharacterized protein LOC115611913 isoform X2 [Strigops habroptila]